MKFMLMIMTDEKAEAALRPAEIDAIIAQHTTIGRELHATHTFVDSHRLRFSRDAITLRRHNDEWIPSDGPFAESKEQLGGFYLIEAASLQEAVEWAQRLPLRTAGAIEVRPARTGAQWRHEIRGSHKFMVMFIANWDKPQTKAEIFQAIDSHYELSLELAAQGKFVASRALELNNQAVTLRRTNGQTTVSDGPFAETKEFVAGYFVIACDSRDEAITWAQQLAFGSHACEVRPVWEGE